MREISRFIENRNQKKDWNCLNKTEKLTSSMRSEASPWQAALAEFPKPVNALETRGDVVKTMWLLDSLKKLPTTKIGKQARRKQ